MIARRTVLTGLAASAGAPARSGAQPAPTRPKRIALLSPGADPQRPVFNAFRAGMRDLGYIEGRDFVLEPFMAGGSGAELLPALAARAVASAPDIILADGGNAAAVARAATGTIPIIAVVGVDPMERGWVPSLARPGGNLTGITTFSLEVVPKHVQLLLDVVPSIRRVAILFGNLTPATLRAAHEAGSRAGIEMRDVFVVTRADVERGLDRSSLQDIDGIVVAGDPVLGGLLSHVVARINASGLPAIYGERDYVDGGGLMSYGVNINDVFRKLAGYFDRVLKGARPADLPIERPSKLEFVINLRTAKMQGLAIPTSVFARADEVIE